MHRGPIVLLTAFRGALAQGFGGVGLEAMGRTATYTRDSELSRLLSGVVCGRGVLACGVGVVGFSSAFVKEEGYRLRIPGCQAPDDTVAVYHDSRGAPYAADPEGNEYCDLMVSFTDDGSVTLCAWARVEGAGPLAGLGIDLCSPDDFPSDEFHKRIHSLIFTPQEDEAARLAYPESDSKGFAYAFSGKEAAFKATAHALREHYRHSDTEYYFEMSYFETLSDETARGAVADGPVTCALEALRIERIELSHCDYADMVCTVAVALEAR